MIHEEDVKSVARSISVELTEEEIQAVINLYPGEQAEDPSATWDLVVEKIIYDIQEG